MLLVLTLASVATGCTRIGPGYVGILVNQAGNQRGVQDFTVTTGRVWYNPAATTVVEYPTFVQNVVWTSNLNEGNRQDESITFTNKDSMIIKVNLNVSYHIQCDPPPGKCMVPQFYVRFRTDDLKSFSDGYMHNVARDELNKIGGQYGIETIMGDNGQFILAVHKAIQDRLLPDGVIIDQFGLIGAPEPPESVRESINMKIQATQIALQKQNEILQSEAEAKKMIAVAQGQAEANRLLTQSISPQLVEWQRLAVADRWINRWNGGMPYYYTGNIPGGSALFNVPAPK